MLTISPAATQAIERILFDADVPPGSGLRIQSTPPKPADRAGPGGDGDISIVIAADALGGDQVLEQEGARVFIEPAVSEFLDDKVLDIAPSPGGSSFTLAEVR